MPVKGWLFMNFKEAFSISPESKTDNKFVFVKGNTRISVIADRLFRVEFSENGKFTDLPTQKVWCRNFDCPEFETSVSGNTAVVKTKLCSVAVNCSNGKVLYAEISGKKIKDLKKGNLGGTYRTLDGTVGAIPLGKGIVSENGTALFDDSKSLLIDKNGEICPRKDNEKDLYVFAYGRDYRAAVRDFLRLTGGVPLIPRFAFGNWWSRYKAYTQQEYIDLIKRFEKEGIPLTVATIDMDWHWVNLKREFSGVPGTNPADIKSGWTGYSWNTHLFPDYREFLKWLKSQNLKITVNLHPADGVRFFENRYADFAKYMGVDPKTKKKIPFDCADKKYMEAYFEYLHHPYENEGVDFWWIDWQQGKKSSLKGLDPLWALNHYHYLDNCRGGKRGMILSRFAQAGSQRYPLGFSGDTTINWNCLRFQPYSTAAAANIGYTWWSHDIGGHMRGKKDDELYIRWVQFGVFSPVNRLHSTSNEFMGKEPWKYGFEANKIVSHFLRLRRRLIPYIYTMNYHTHKYGRALMEPMYYGYPDSCEAYKCRNQYFFGSELIAAPITDPADKKTGFASVTVWLPQGRYTDIFTRRSYNGGGFVKMFRQAENFPVLAKEGAIIPLDADDTSNAAQNPSDFEILAFSGNGSFILYEDDGETMNYKNGAFAETKFEINTAEKDIIFKINPADGDCSVIPENRNYKINFFDTACADNVKVYINGIETEADVLTDDSVCVTVCHIAPSDAVEIKVFGASLCSINHREEYIETVSKYHIGNEQKKKVFTEALESNVLPKCAKRFREPLEELERCL